MSDKEIIAALIKRDEKVTAQIFFKECRPLFLSVIRQVFGTQIVDYNEIISEIYILLMENDAKRLRQFHFESTLYQWLKTTSIRHCQKLKAQAKVIDNESKESLNNSNRDFSFTENSQAKTDLGTLMNQIKNQRYALVLRMLMIEDMTPENVAQRLSITVDNLYNIKRRAILALTEVALKDKRHYER